MLNIFKQFHYTGKKTFYLYKWVLVLFCFLKQWLYWAIKNQVFNIQSKFLGVRKISRRIVQIVTDKQQHTLSQPIGWSLLHIFGHFLSQEESGGIDVIITPWSNAKTEILASKSIIHWFQFCGPCITHKMTFHVLKWHKFMTLSFLPFCLLFYNNKHNNV